MPGPLASTAGFSALLSGQRRLLTVHTSSGRWGWGGGGGVAPAGLGQGGKCWAFLGV